MLQEIPLAMPMIRVNRQPEDPPLPAGSSSAAPVLQPETNDGTSPTATRPSGSRRRKQRSRPRRFLRAAGAFLGIVLFAVWWIVLRIEEKPSWPPPQDALTAAEAQAATEAFVGRSDVRHNDVGVPFAPTTASDLQIFADGEFFPPILQDLAGASRSIHILEFGWRPGTVSDQFVAVVEERLRAGVEVRIIVDDFGSRATSDSAGLYTKLAEAGAEIVTNNVFPLDRDGLLPDPAIDWRQDEVGQADHRKLFVIDGQTAWIGGAGIEDHFADGRYYDMFNRVQGDVVRQLQAVFLMSFHAYGGPLPHGDGALAPYFPPPHQAGTIPVTLVQNIRGGFVAGTQAIRALIENATTQLDIMNPYLTDPGILDRIVAAAERGVHVRVLVPEHSNNAPAQYALEHSYDRLLTAGIEIWEHPAVMHAKVVVADDMAILGTINLDAWALYRDAEIALVVEDPQLTRTLRSDFIEPQIIRSVAAEVPDSLREQLRNWLMRGIVYFL